MRIATYGDSKARSSPGDGSSVRTAAINSISASRPRARWAPAAALRQTSSSRGRLLSGSGDRIGAKVQEFPFPESDPNAAHRNRAGVRDSDGIGASIPAESDARKGQEKGNALDACCIYGTRAVSNHLESRYLINIATRVLCYGPSGVAQVLSKSWKTRVAVSPMVDGTCTTLKTCEL